MSYLLLLESEEKLFIKLGHHIIQAITIILTTIIIIKLLKNKRTGPVPKNTLAPPMEFKTLDITTHNHSMRIPYSRKISYLFLDRYQVKPVDDLFMVRSEDRLHATRCFG